MDPLAAASANPLVVAREGLLPLRWPTPPYASYGGHENGSDEPGAPGLDCLVEGSNGQVRSCRLMRLDLPSGVAHIQVPPSRTTMPLRFGMFRRISLTQPLAPLPQGPDKASPEADSKASGADELMNHRPRLPYALELSDGTALTGTTIGHLESAAGVFLFIPLDEHDRVQRVFLPAHMVRQIRVGESIGQVLVEQHAVTPEQVERAAREQEQLRNRKSGDHLVLKEVVEPEQLLQALEEQARMPMVRIGEALTALGLITPEQLQDPLERQKNEPSVPLGELLVQSGLLSRDDLRLALARKMGYPVVDLARFPIDPEALRRVPIALARKHRVLPLLWHSGTVVVATDDPSRRGMLKELDFLLQAKVLATLANTPLGVQGINEAYARFGLDDTQAALAAGGEFAPTSSDKLLESLEQEASDDADPKLGAIEQSDNSLVKLINSLIIEAHGQGASDIHIETFASKRKVRIRLRKDGRLSPFMELPPGYRNAIIGRIKVMCDLDISERRKPQDGKIDFAKFSPTHKLELRVATIPTSNGAEDVVLRLLSSAKPLPLDQLGLTPANLRQLQAAVARPHGMVLCVGPTGSGKTTTLHSLLQHINTPDRKIWTAEDPVEISNPDLRQVQINPKIDWTFAKALRAFLRADPDIIMVGEIRDAETAQMAIEASLTGHLVLSTLHTNSAPETVVRLLDMGMDPFNFADSLAAVLAQRLVRRWCKGCVRSEPADETWVDELLDDYLHVLPEALRPSKAELHAQWLHDYGQDGQLLKRHAPGCPACDQTGYKGRLGVHELLLIDGPLRRLIQRKAPSEALQEAAQIGGGLRTLRQDGILKVLQGLTSIDEVRAHCTL